MLPPNAQKRAILELNHLRKASETYADNDWPLPNHIPREMPSIAGFDADHIRVAIKYLATGSTGGFSGITPRQLLELTACEEAYDDGGLQHALAGLAAKWARGLASTELREWIPGAPFTTLRKPNNEVPYRRRKNSPPNRVQVAHSPKH